ncbi:5818_t:CDS:1 [Ambispora leptoticha]|uniref:5818_t:CDS:1 n=1 Tax=Ambispora leptoticha TaxID=144679 RepID=A0A9N8WM22_9GLOM|nr:5818_t:CDS:1 [Ambispora leptoticha]
MYKPIDCLDLLIAADEMLLEELLKEIQSFFINNKTFWNHQILPEVLNAVIPRTTCHKLSHFCFEHVIEHDASLVFKSQSFRVLDKSILLQIMRCNDLNIREIDIWNNLIKWIFFNCLQVELFDVSSQAFLFDDEKELYSFKETLDNFLPFIRFFEISTVDFVKYVQPFQSILPKSLFSDLVKYHISGIFKSLNPETKFLAPRLPPITIGSSIIKPKHASLIASWIEGHPKILNSDLRYKFRRLYRSSLNGTATNPSKEFHKKCDNAGPTILVVKLQNSSEIIGGYNPMLSGWKRSWFNSSHGSKDAFLFSFSSGKSLKGARLIRVLKKYHEYAIYDHPFDGPCFGIGPDLWVSLNNEKKTGKTVRKAYKENLRRQKNEIFYWDDWEIFQVSHNF